MPLGAFDNNTAHSNKGFGLLISNHWDPRENPCNWGGGSNFDSNPAVRAVLNDFTGYKNVQSGVSALQIGQVRFVFLLFTCLNDVRSVMPMMAAVDGNAKLLMMMIGILMTVIQMVVIGGFIGIIVVW
jgi:hypothetical protein